MTTLEPLEGRQLFAAAPRVYLTGNSLTDGINYAGFAALLGRDGPVTLGRQTGSGYTIYANRTLQTGYATSGYDPARPGVTNPWGNYQQAFAAAKWDDFTIQPNDRRLVSDPKDVGTPTAHDEADVPNAEALLKAFAVKNTAGQAFIYSRASRRTDVNVDLTPTGQPFDYSTEWLKTYDDHGDHNLPFITRSYVKQFMPLIRQAQAADATTKGLPPVRLIPVGEAYYNIDQAIKAGKFKGTAVTSMLDLYRDQSHPSDDVAAYVIALSFYASITGHDPRGVAPPSAYLFQGSRITDPKVQTLLQQAVYDAITSPVYSGYTTPLTTSGGGGGGTAVYRGYVIGDTNRNGKWDSGELGLTGRTVWLDLDNDGVLDANEARQLTGKNGLFEFDGLKAGSCVVREVVPNGSVQSSPTNNAGLKATLTAGQIKSGQYFAVRTK